MLCPNIQSTSNSCRGLSNDISDPPFSILAGLSCIKLFRSTAQLVKANLAKIRSPVIPRVSCRAPPLVLLGVFRSIRVFVPGCGARMSASLKAISITDRCTLGDLFTFRASSPLRPKQPCRSRRSVSAAPRYTTNRSEPSLFESAEPTRPATSC